MPIQADNLKIRAAATMDDTPLNGGPPSSTVIQDGVSNQIFPDVSEMDRAGGSTIFRKIYPWVDTADTDTLYGANIVISEAPTDAATSVVIFPAASVGETQADVITRLGGTSGGLTANQRDNINPDCYLWWVALPGGLYGATLQWTDAAGGYHTNVVAGPNGAYFFQMQNDLPGVALTRILVGQTITLVDFYQGQLVQIESLTISRVLVAFGGVLALEFDSPSAYPGWGLANSLWVDSGTDSGTYLIENNVTSGLRRAEYYGATRLTASASPASRTVTVADLDAGIVPSALMVSPAAESVLGFRPGLLTKNVSGREPILQAGRFVVLGKNVEIIDTFAPGVRSVGETLIKRVKILDSTGARIAFGWSANMDTGEVTITSTTGWAQPAKIVARVEDMAMIVSVNASAKTILLGKDLLHSYPVGSSVSSALPLGNTSARITAFFDQTTWSGEWSSAVIGSSVTGAQYNRAAYPIEMTNAGAITERWRIQFTSGSAFTVTGETVGQVAVGNTSSTCAPINPATGVPYFELDPAGWGLGWSAGNVLRIDTAGAAPPCWLIRCVQQSAETLLSANFEAALRGGVNRP